MFIVWGERLTWFHQWRTQPSVHIYSIYGRYKFVHNLYRRAPSGCVYSSRNTNGVSYIHESHSKPGSVFYISFLVHFLITWSTELSPCHVQSPTQPTLTECHVHVNQQWRMISGLYWSLRNGFLLDQNSHFYTVSNNNSSTFRMTEVLEEEKWLRQERSVSWRCGTIIQLKDWISSSWTLSCVTEICHPHN